jgi:hypothetical protein
MHRFIRSLVAGTAAMAVSWSLPLLASAENWGAGSWGGSAIRCLEVDDPGGYKSECNTENDFYRVYIDSDVPSAFRTQLVATVEDDYDPIIEFVAIVQDSLTTSTDARVRVASIPSGTSWAYTTCQNNATYGGGSGYYRWCRKQLFRFDPTRGGMQNCLASTNCLRWLACHEIGHTTGLQHPGNYPNVNSSRVTCMDYEDDVDPDLHDVDHLKDCYPIPSPPQPALTSSCKY